MSLRLAIARLWQPHLTPLQQAAWATLTPFAAAYRLGLATHSLRWRGRASRAPVATIGIGNLTVGGNAKTPFALFLAERLSQRGYRVAIVSRGYGRSTSDPVLVADQGRLLLNSQAAGDEPAMLARRFAGPIAVAHRRFDAIAMLAARGPLDAVILDDAFQHRRLTRELDLVLFAGRGVGNGWLLPAGPLREPLTHVRRAHAAILITRDGEESPAGCRPLDEALAPLPTFHARVRPKSLIRLIDGAWRESALVLRDRRIVAVSGLADPAPFLASLGKLGAAIVKNFAYPDHYRYTPSDWRAISRTAQEAEMVVTTEKDLVKLAEFSPALASLYAVRLEVVMPEADETRMLAMVTGSIERWRSAASGLRSSVSTRVE